MKKGSDLPKATKGISVTASLELRSYPPSFMLLKESLPQPEIAKHRLIHDDWPSEECKSLTPEI